MKLLFTGMLILLCFATVKGQSVSEGKTSLSMGIQYTHEFTLDGYVRVREWELEGDKMSLKELGMGGYAAVNMFVVKHFPSNRSLQLSYDRYFMQGTSYFERDIAYNGTLINARNGIDVSPTRYYRLMLQYTGNIGAYKVLSVQYLVGVVYDHITFYLDGDVSQLSMRNEVYEQFGRQAFPYPYVGIKGTYDFNDFSGITFTMQGTYIPEFKSIFTEGGPVNLQYNYFQTDLSYVRHIRKLDIGLGTKTRYMHLLERSEEDTNLLSTFTGGPYIHLAYNL